MAVFNYPQDISQTQWRTIDGDFYVSIWGDNNNNGSASAPFKTIQKAVNMASNYQKIVVGSGTYFENVDGLSKRILIVAEHNVIMDGSAIGGVAFTNFGNNINTSFVAGIKGFRIEGYKYAFQNWVRVVDNCNVSKCDIDNFKGTIKNSIISDCFYDTADVNNYLINNTFLRVRTDDSASNIRFKQIIDCHFDSSCIFYIKTANTTDFDYCNQEPGSVFYVEDTAYLDHSTLQAAYNQYQAHGVSALPGFNYPELDDYSLSLSSPLLYASSSKNYIGALDNAVSINSKTQPQATLTNVEIDYSGSYVLPDNHDVGFIETRIIDLGKVQEIGNINLIAKQWISSEAPGFAVVDMEDSEVPVIQPGILTFQMRYAGSIMPDVSEDRCELQKSYKEFIWNRKPTIDGANRANGEVGFDVKRAKVIKARYIQLRFRLKGYTKNVEITNNEYLTSSSSSFFLNHLVGWRTSGDGNHLLKTIDGQNFTQIVIPNELSKVFFIDTRNGWGWDSTSQYVYKSADGGETWTKVNEGTYQFKDIYFTDLNNGYGCFYNAIYKTVDGGSTWIEKHTEGVESFNRIFFVDKDYGFCCGTNGCILKTVDGGENWTHISYNYTNYFDVFFIDRKRGWCCGSGGAIIKTVDGGVTWSTTRSNEEDEFYSLSFIDTQRGVCGGDILLSTSDGGSTWKRVDTEILDNSYYNGIVNLYLSPTGICQGSTRYGRVFRYLDYPALQSVQILNPSKNIGFKVMDVFGHNVEGADVTIETNVAGTVKQLELVTDIDGCVSCQLPTNMLSTMNIYKDNYLFYSTDFELLEEVDIQDAAHNMVIKVVNQAGVPMSGVNVKIQNDNGLIQGTTDSNGFYEATIDTNYANDVTVYTNDDLFSYTIPEFIPFSCGSENCMVSPQIGCNSEYRFVPYIKLYEDL